MLENKVLLKSANNPYYFLEFWLYMVNGGNCDSIQRPNLIGSFTG